MGWGVLERVVGRRPPVLDSLGCGLGSGKVAVVEEFGRDATAAERLARGKRRLERKRIRTEARDRRREATDSSADPHPDDRRGGDGADRLLPADVYDSDGDVGDDERLERKERRLALSDAARTATEELEE